MMNSESLRQLASELIERDKWSDILQRFIEVLRINIVIVDFEGNILLHPASDRYGSKLLANSMLGLDFSNKPNNTLAKFKRHGSYLEFESELDLRYFAIPLTIETDEILAYMIVGPVILNRRLEDFDYEAMCKTLKLNFHDIKDLINEIRVLSFVTMKSILDLLSEVSRYNVQLIFEKQKLHKMRFQKEILPKDLSDAAQDIFSTICLDELLVTLLDVALDMAKAECGSIMVLDKEANELVIKVSRGIEKDVVINTRLKVGEGIAGLAVQEKTPYLLMGKQGENRIKHLLKRPEIKHALIMPLGTEKTIFGVLNLHTKKSQTAITPDTMELIGNLVKITSAAIQSIQSKA